MNKNPFSKARNSKSKKPKRVEIFPDFVGKMKFLLLSMISSFSAMYVINDSPAGLRDSPIHRMQFDLDFDHLESLDRIQAELDGEKDVKALASELTAAINALNELQVTNENLMRVLELMEIINKTKAARWQYYIDISVSSFIGGVLAGLIFGAAMIVFNSKFDHAME